LKPFQFMPQVLNRKTTLFVGGLKKEDVSIFQGGTRQVISEFIEEDSPVSVVLLLDISGSMQDGINLIKAVVTESLRPLKRDDEVSLITFADKPEVIVEFTKDKRLVDEKVGELTKKKIHGATNELEGLFVAATHLNNASNSSGRRIIVVITDNMSNNSSQPHSQKDVIKTLTVGGVIVHGLITPSGGLQSGPMPVLNFRSGFGPYIQETGGVLLDLGSKRIVSRLMY
jgi:VWFA-related protein